jgi:hypothetical protein
LLGEQSPWSTKPVAASRVRALYGPEGIKAAAVLANRGMTAAFVDQVRARQK